MMKKSLITVTILLLTMLTFTLAQQDPVYQSEKTCKECHDKEDLGRQTIIWEKTGHAGSYLALTSEKALTYAKEKGMEVMPAENPKCLKCHAPLHAKAPEIMKEGVTCEACHPPEQAHEPKKEIKDWCLSCHKNTQDKTFDFPAYWEKVKHPRPETEGIQYNGI